MCRPLAVYRERYGSSVYSSTADQASGTLAPTNRLGACEQIVSEVGWSILTLDWVAIVEQMPSELDQLAIAIPEADWVWNGLTSR